MLRQLGGVRTTDEIVEQRSADVEELIEVGRVEMVPMLNVLWAHRRLLGKAAISGLILFGIVSLLIPNRYESTVKLMPPDPQGAAGMALMASMAGSAGVPSAATGIASSLLGLKSSGETFIGILSSRTAQDDIINRFDLRKVYWYKRYEDTRKKLASRTDLEEDKKSGIITIRVSDHDRLRAREIAAAYIDELDKLNAKLSTSSARRERIFLEGRLAEVKKDLDAASRDLGEFSSKNSTLDFQSEGKAMVESAAELQGNLIAAESELQGLRTIYTDNNARVRGLQARVNELQRQLQKLTGTSSTNFDAELSPDQLYPSLRQLPVLGVKYLELYRRLKIEEAVFEALTKQYEIAKVEEAKEIPTVKVLDAPSLPERKSFPPRLLITFSGMLLSIAAVCAWVALQRHWNELDGADPGKQFAMEVWGTTRGGVRNFLSLRRLYFHPLQPDGMESHTRTDTDVENSFDRSKSSKQNWQ